MGEETRRILLDGGIVEVRRDGDLLIAPDGRCIEAEQAVHLPPVVPTKIICVHLNYRSRAEELRTAPPPAPHYFHKPLSCLNSHKGSVVRPRGCRFLNYEGEVAIVIGRATRNIRIAEAPAHIAGYTLANDFALHDFRDADRGAMLRVKGADTLGVVGPGLVRDWRPADQRLRTRVNGKVVQESSVAGMIFSMAYLVADLARTMTLLPGDLILSGTPANSRPVAPGDVVTVEVEGLGMLESRIVEGASGVSQECGWAPSASEKVIGVALGQELRE
ncbi:MAG TPA: fumarylacetoacetate hydrolase family protein [Steroidobacteraceae bacterium]|nr:fumarylacetoacetate hydrolase family protein [Steroidobacteraceae bacterium]